MSHNDEAQSGAAAMSLDDRIKEYHVTPDDLKCSCTPERAAEIAKHFSEWRLANAHLNVTPDEVRVIEVNHKIDENLKRQAFLEKWIAKNGDKATYLMLLKALDHCCRIDLVESLLKLIKQDAQDDGLDSDSDDEVKEGDKRLFCGCGKCTLADFLKSGCPHPWKPSRYPLLNITKLNKEQKLELLSRLDQEAENVSSKFGSLMSNIYKCLKETDVKELVLFLLSQQKFSGMKDEDRKELLANLRNAKDTGDVLMFLVEGLSISWFNHPLLGSIAKKFDVCKADYDEYVDKVFDPYIQRCLFEIPSNMSQEFKGSGKFTLKVNTQHLEYKDKTKAEILLPLRRHVSEVCGIAIDAFDICSYEKGCLQVTVAAPLALLEEIFPLSDDALNGLSSFSYEGAHIESISFGEQYHPVPIKHNAPTTASILKHTTALTDMINKFASLVVELYISIKEKLPEVKQYLLGSVYVFQQRTDQGQLFQNGVQEEIERASTAADLMVILGFFWSFYNYFLLSKMIRKFCNDDDVVRRNLDEYANSLEELSPAQYPPIVQPYTNEECFHTDLFAVEVEGLNGINGDTLSQIHSSVARWLTIESHALLLKRIRRNTNKLEYLIPKCVTIDMTTSLSQLDASVIRISFGKTVTACCKGKRSNEGSDFESGFRSGSTDDERSSYSVESEPEHNDGDIKRKKCYHIKSSSSQSLQGSLRVKSSQMHKKTSDFKYNPSAPAFTSQSDVHLSPGFELSPRDCLPDDATSSDMLQILLQENEYPMMVYQAYEHHTWLETFQELLKWKTNFQSRLENTTLQETEVEAELTVGNYRNKFYHLLCYEESAHISLLTEKCDGKYTFILTGKGRDGYIAEISGMDGNKVQYATQASEAVFLFHTITGEEICKASILPSNYRTVDDVLAIHLSTSAVNAFKQKVGKDKCKIYARFEVKHHYFDTLHKAVVNIPHSMILKIVPLRKSIEAASSLLPRQHSTNPLPKSLSLDDSVQNQALNLMLHSSPSVPVIVSGPFGSGKTRLLGRAAYGFGENGLATKTQTRILICARHFSKIESITSVLAQEFQKEQGVKVVQILRNNFKRGASNVVYSSMQSFTDDVKQGRHIGDPILILITTYFSSLQVANVLSSKDFCFRFTHILLDEAAQVREPEAIAALSLGDENTKVVIAGDSKQDSPRVAVLGDIARDNGLKISLLERLERRYDEIGRERYLIHLDVSYRCHPMLTKLLSDVVYKYPIKSPANHESSAKVCPCFFYYCHTISEVSEAATPSLSVNAMEAEAKAAISWLEKLESQTKEFEIKNEADSVCVVSSFRKQLKIIKKDMQGKFKHVLLKPTYTIQGHEYKTVIICAYEPLEADGTSTDSTRTLVQPGIFNTVVSHSKQQVIVVGNPFRLLDLEKRMNTNPECWNEYIKLCLKNDTMLYSDDIEQSKIDRLLRAKVGINDCPPLQRSISPNQYKTSCPPSLMHAESETPSSQRMKSKSEKKNRSISADVIYQQQKQTKVTPVIVPQTKATIPDTVQQEQKLKQTKATIPDVVQQEQKPKATKQTKKNSASLETSTKKSKSTELSSEAKSPEKRKKKRCIEEPEQASDIKQDRNIKTVQYPPRPSDSATAVTKEPMYYTVYKKPVLSDDTAYSKRQREKSPDIPVTFNPNPSEPQLEVVPEAVANKDTSFVVPGVSFADALKSKSK